MSVVFIGGLNSRIPAFNGESSSCTYGISEVRVLQFIRGPTVSKQIA